MSFPITPREDRVFVIPVPSPEKTKGGLIIPDSAKEPPTIGVILKLGEFITCQECGKKVKMKVHLGQIVLFPTGAGYDLEWDNTKVKCIRYSDIWATDLSITLPQEILDSLKKYNIEKSGGA